MLRVDMNLRMELTMQEIDVGDDLSGMMLSDRISAAATDVSHVVSSMLIAPFYVTSCQLSTFC
jgi:hypothetical protein